MVHHNMATTWDLSYIGNQKQFFYISTLLYRYSFFAFECSHCSVCDLQEAEVSGKKVPEPFDVHTEKALDASIGVDSSFAKASSPKPAEEDVLSKKAEAAFIRNKQSSQQPFNPFCNVDQVQLSIHCHANAVNCLITIPGMILSNVGKNMAWGASTLILLLYSNCNTC